MRRNVGVRKGKVISQGVCLRSDPSFVFANEKMRRIERELC